MAPLGALVFIGPRAAVVTFAAFAGLVVLSGLIDPWLAARAEPLPRRSSSLFFVLDLLGVAFVTSSCSSTSSVSASAPSTTSTWPTAPSGRAGAAQEEQARSEALLRNILPDAVAERLKSGASVIADGYEAVTVLFVDIVDFTPLASASRPPTSSRCSTASSASSTTLSERYGLEKIKTVGDAYIAVAGLPEPLDAEAGAMAAAEMALEVFAAVERAAGRATGPLHGSASGSTRDRSWPASSAGASSPTTCGATR